jgi:hypothetical protein
LVEHDLIRKSVSTFRNHALTDQDQDHAGDGRHRAGEGFDAVFSRALRCGSPDAF